MAIPAKDHAFGNLKEQQSPRSAIDYIGDFSAFGFRIYMVKIKDLPIMARTVRASHRLLD